MGQYLSIINCVKEIRVITASSLIHLALVLTQKTVIAKSYHGNDRTVIFKNHSKQAFSDTVIMAYNDIY